MKLVENWKDAWKWMSVQFAAAIVVWPLVPIEGQTAVVQMLTDLFGFKVSVPAVLAILLIIGRVVDQGGGKSAPPPKE